MMRVRSEVMRINHARAQSGVVFVFAMVWGLSWFLCCGVGWVLWYAFSVLT